VVVAFAPNLRGWDDVPMAALLEQALQAPVVVENDVNLAVLAEHWRGAARGHDTCAFITVGTGIGAGIVVDGRLHRGHSFLAGEIGLMCMGPQYVDQDFGSRGCLETLVGLKALAERWPHVAQRDPERWVAELFEAAEAGDARARKAADEAATLIGIAAANLSLVLDPSLIVLGGALVVQGEPLVREVRRIVARILPGSRRIVVSALGKEAPLWGSLLVATTAAREQLRQRLRPPAAG
jgi:glucokinase